MNNCLKCNGLLARDLDLEFETKRKPAYKCLNCGKCIDRVILRNEETPLAEYNPKPERVHKYIRHYTNHLYIKHDKGIL